MLRGEEDRPTGDGKGEKPVYLCLPLWAGRDVHPS